MTLITTLSLEIMITIIEIIIVSFRGRTNIININRVLHLPLLWLWLSRQRESPFRLKVEPEISQISADVHCRWRPNVQNKDIIENQIMLNSQRVIT